MQNFAKIRCAILHIEFSRNFAFDFAVASQPRASSSLVGAAVVRVSLVPSSVARPSASQNLLLHFRFKKTKLQNAKQGSQLARRKMLRRNRSPKIAACNLPPEHGAKICYSTSNLARMEQDPQNLLLHFRLQKTKPQNANQRSQLARRKMPRRNQNPKIAHRPCNLRTCPPPQVQARNFATPLSTEDNRTAKCEPEEPAYETKNAAAQAEPEKCTRSFQPSPGAERKIFILQCQLNNTRRHHYPKKANAFAL